MNEFIEVERTCFTMRALRCRSGPPTRVQNAMKLGIHLVDELCTHPGGNIPPKHIVKCPQEILLIVNLPLLNASNAHLRTSLNPCKQTTVNLYKSISPLVGPKVKHMLLSPCPYPVYPYVASISIPTSPSCARRPRCSRQAWSPRPDGLVASSLASSVNTYGLVGCRMCPAWHGAARPSPVTHTACERRSAYRTANERCV